MSDPSPQVLVVGAGPTGLLLAAELERRDVPCLLIDALDAPRGWDRATVVHARSTGDLRGARAGGPAPRPGREDPRRRGSTPTATSSASSTSELSGQPLRLRPRALRGGDRVGPHRATSSAHGGAVTRSTRLVEPGAGRRRGDGDARARRRARARSSSQWVVGCDGLHSAVREAAGIEFPGTDDRGASGRSSTRPSTAGTTTTTSSSAHLDVPPVILTPLPGRRWRVYLRPTSETSDLVAEAERGAPALQARRPRSPTSRTRPGSTATRASRRASARAASCSRATPRTPARRRRATG